MGVDLPLALPLTLSIRCRSGGRARGARHPVVIEPDWSWRTGHDEDLERIAAAFGGGVSCLPLLAGALPAFRQWWQRARREVIPLVVSTDQGATWASVDGTLACCPVSGFADPGGAAEHARGPRHVAVAVGVDPRDVAALVAGLGPDGDPGPPPGPGGDGHGALGDRTWACGLPPDWVAASRAALHVVGAGEACLRVLLALAQTGADPRWVAASAGSRGDAGLAEWLAWTEGPIDRVDRGARARWLATGTRRADVACLSGSGYPPEAAQQVAHDWGISVPGAAVVLSRWVSSGYLPTPADLASTRDAGHSFPPHPPSPAAVDRVARGVPGGRRAGSRRSGEADAPARDATALAIALVRCGTVADTLAELRRSSAGGRGRPAGGTRMSDPPATVARTGGGEAWHATGLGTSRC